LGDPAISRRSPPGHCSLPDQLGDPMPVELLEPRRGRVEVPFLRTYRNRFRSQKERMTPSSTSCLLPASPGLVSPEPKSGPEPSPPRAFSVSAELAATRASTPQCSRFTAAFRSRS